MRAGGGGVWLRYNDSKVLQFTKDNVIAVVDTEFYIVGNSSACSSAGRGHSLVHNCLALPGLLLQPWSPTAPMC